MDERAKKNFLITAAYIVTVGAIVFIVCRFLLKYLMPFIIGGLIAWAVQKPAYYISGKTRLNSKISAALLTAAVFALLAAALFFAVLGFTTAAGGIMRELSVRAGDMGKMLSSLRNNFDALFKRLPDEFGSAARYAVERLFSPCGFGCGRGGIFLCGGCGKTRAVLFDQLHCIGGGGVLHRCRFQGTFKICRRGYR